MKRRPREKSFYFCVTLHLNWKFWQDDDDDDVVVRFENTRQNICDPIYYLQITMGRRGWSGTVDRVVAYETSEPVFESSHRRLKNPVLITGFFVKI